MTRCQRGQMLAEITDCRETDLTTPADAAAQLRSRAYLRLLALGALLGVPISAAAWGFLALVARLQHWLYASLPVALGFRGAPVWWPIPLLLIGGLLVALAIRFLPGTGGHEPADGLQAGGPAHPREIPGIVLAALVSLGVGAVIGPEAPLIALGGALSVLAVSRTQAAAAPRTRALVGSIGSFAAISTLLGSPIVGAFLLMEMASLSGTAMELMLLPGLLGAGLGALIFTGLGEWSGLGTFSLSIGGLPHFARPNVAELGWAVVAGLAAALASVAIRRGAVLLRETVRRQPLLWTPVAGLVVAALAIAFAEGTGKGVNKVLFSGQTALGPLVMHAAGYSAAALVLLFACKALAYGVSLSAFRGGPIFPAIFIGAVGGAALSHLPGLPLVPAVGMGIAAMIAGMLRLPMTAVLLAALLLASDAAAVTPLAIVAVVTTFMAVNWLDPVKAPGQAASGEGHARAAAPRQDPDTGEPQHAHGAG